jgi:hypothetical protein
VGVSTVSMPIVPVTRSEVGLAAVAAEDAAEEAWALMGRAG